MLVLVVALLVPGWCLFSLLGLKAISPALAIATAISLGLSIVSIAAWLAWLSGTGMIGAAFLTSLATASAIVARIVWRKRAEAVEKPGPFDFGVAALAAFAAGLALVSGPWLGQAADAFYHLAAARALLMDRMALPQDTFVGGQVPYPDVTGGSLHLVLAWLSLAGGMITAWTGLAIFGAAFTTLCVAAFAREVTRSTAAALIGTGLYLLVGLNLDMRAAGYPNRIAPGLAWLSFVFLLRFARSGSRPWRELVPACLLAFAAASVHSGTPPLIAVVVSMTFLIAALAAARARRLSSLVPLAIASAAVMLAVLPLLAVRILSALPAPSIESSLAIQAPGLRVHVLLGYALIDPRFWFGGLVTVATVGTLCLLGRPRRLLLDGDPGAALLWGGLLIVPAVALTPLVTSWANGLYFLARVAALMSLLLFVSWGWGLSAVSGFAGAILRRAAGPRSAPKLAAGLVLVIASAYVLADQVPGGALAIYSGSASGSLSDSRANNLTVLWADRLRALDSAGPGIVLADARGSFELAGLTGRRVVAVPFTHRTYQDEARDGALRRGDVADALDPSADPTALLSVLIRYEVTFVMVDRTSDSPATWDWMAGQNALVTVAGGSTWRLYRFDPGRIDQALDVPLHGGVGLVPSRVIAGRAVFVRVASPGQQALVQAKAVGLASGATFQTQIEVSGPAGATFTAPLLVPDSAPVDRYAVTVNMPGGAPLAAGEIEVGRAYEAEYFAGVVFNLAQGFVLRPGWNSVDNPIYTRGSAALALQVGSVASHPIADPPGDYCLSLLVFDAGDGRSHTLDVGLGGSIVSVTWSGAFKGMREVEVPAQEGSASRQLTYWVPAGAAAGAIVDQITLYPPPEPGGFCGHPPGS